MDFYISLLRRKNKNSPQVINRGASFQSLLDPLPVFGLGLWGSAPLRRSVTFLCMCERVLEPVCSVTQDRSFILKNGVTLFGECVLPSWCPLVVLGMWDFQTEAFTLRLSSSPLCVLRAQPGSGMSSCWSPWPGTGEQGWETTPLSPSHNPCGCG